MRNRPKARYKGSVLFLVALMVPIFALGRWGQIQVDKINNRPLVAPVLLEAKTIHIPRSPIEKMAYRIKKYFPEDIQTALAVFKHESGLDPTKINWNCYYGDKSTSCKPQDRAMAWSVDCGLTMINVMGQKCPDELFDPETNLQKARAKYERRGWQPWVAHWDGSYRSSLEWAEGLLAKI